MGESVEVAIIGAGQAGLATSWYLKQAGVDFQNAVPKFKIVN